MVIDLGVIVGVLSPVVMFIAIFTFIKKQNKDQYQEGVNAGERKQKQENFRKSIDAAHSKIRGIEGDCEVRLLQDTQFKTELKTKLNSVSDSVGIMVGKMDTVQTDIAALKENVGII